MINSPKTVASFSQIQSALDEIMNHGSDIIQNTSQNKKIIEQKGIQNQEEQKMQKEQYFMSLNIKNKDLQLKPFQFNQKSHISIQSNLFKENKRNQEQFGRCDQIQNKNSINNSRQNTQQKQKLKSNEKPRPSSQSINSNQCRQNYEKSTFQRITQNSSTNSFSFKQQNKSSDSPTNLFRKSVQGDAVLQAIQSMFKKKGLQSNQNNNIKHEQNQYQNRRIKSRQKGRQYRINHKNINKKQILIQTNSQIAYEVKQKLQKRFALQQRLKNIHVFYKLTIDEQIKKRKQNDQAFIEFMQINNRNHHNKLISYKSQGHFMKNYTNIDELGGSQRIQQFQSNIQQTIHQVQKLRIQNVKVRQKLAKCKQKIKQKQRIVQRLENQQKQYRQQLQKKQRNKLKMIKWQKQMTTMIRKGQEYIAKMHQKHQNQYQS